jgi:zinc protease
LNPTIFAAMIHFEKFYLDNGLEVIVHHDPNTAIVCLNTLYKVGSRNESSDKTGFAHLFEHLMFGGSKHIKSFDEPLQAVGGENNAFTNTDITNYYTTVPSNNVETAFWLESDRMLSLSFDPNVLEVQRSVVIEEYKQRYLNQPYGDVWHLLREQAYKTHPYRWPTIGKSITHIEEATMDDVKAFFGKYYHPANAVLVIAGDINVKTAKSLAEKWYGPIPAGEVPSQAVPVEKKQSEQRSQRVLKDVPNNMFYKTYHMGSRTDPSYLATDLLSDLLGRGKSSLFYQDLVKEKQVLSSVNAYVTGSMDPGLFVIQGQLSPDVSMEQVEEALTHSLNQFSSIHFDKELEKVKNLASSSLVFGEAELLNRAMNLAYASYVDTTESVNEELNKIQKVTSDDVKSAMSEVITTTNENVLYYLTEKE